MSNRAIPPSTSAAQAALAASTNNNLNSNSAFASYSNSAVGQQPQSANAGAGAGAGAGPGTGAAGAGTGTGTGTGTAQPIPPSQSQTFASSSNSSTSPSNPQIVGLHYKLGKKVGEGSFGVIFEGTNMINGVPVAIKFEPRKTEAPQLRDEYRTYKHLAGSPGIPNAYYFGQEGLHNILVIDLLGPSLEDLFDWCGRRFTIKSVCQVAVQMITLIEEVHSHDLIYRDIKPDNFLIGRPGLIDEHQVHLIDFGMAKQYRDPRTKQHIPYREKKSLSGTARYMSVNTHLGREQSRRDDLEALGHVFFYFLRGQLPWQGLKAPTNKQKYEKIGEKKRTTPVLDLCSGLPRQFAVYLETVRGLAFDAEPDYNYLRNLILSALDDLGEKADGTYDWQRLNGGRGWDSAINKKPNLHGYGHPNPPGERERRHHNNHHGAAQHQQGQGGQPAGQLGLQQQQAQAQQGQGQSGRRGGSSRNKTGSNNYYPQQAQQAQQQQQQALYGKANNNRPLPQVPFSSQPQQNGGGAAVGGDYPQYKTQQDPGVFESGYNYNNGRSQQLQQQQQQDGDQDSGHKKICFCF